MIGREAIPGKPRLSALQEMKRIPPPPLLKQGAKNGLLKQAYFKGHLG